jgi:hypothetical protein
VYDTKVETEKGINPNWFGIDGVSMSMPMPMSMSMSKWVEEKERKERRGVEEFELEVMRVRVMGLRQGGWIKTWHWATSRAME